MSSNPLTRTRARVGEALFARVAGKDGHAARERVHGTPGPRWFPQGSAIRRVHGDASMWVGGLRALLLQALHPLAMAGVAGHSGYRGDPWGRLERTSTFIAMTTFGAADDAEAMIERVRTIHDRVRGKAPDGRPYHASDPHLLRWVHVAEADSFLSAHQRYGAKPLTPERADEYLAQAARVASALGATDVPTTVAGLADCLESYRPELKATPAALDTTRFLLHEPPLPAAAKVPYSLMAAGAVALLPAWARTELQVGGGANSVVGPVGGALATRAIRWGLSASLPDYPTL
ncbi:DUF2236 domain-containing protein [Demequina sp. TTPB684]|uniref:oxygenase MpaB family protein n=1 Tax=unclassified Demequina TaxID=2620311 RepID=UPI001CF3FA47|nr:MULTISPECIES: oxygenase MpaB family protein [unclassified Demequina]MCB2414033.1 DUF2236 domain-containing protein [Demequina sp. TTPB684]UPU89087.1 DUF2236 domain-containing protein [Demequina sp. TMPB413]